jgi:LuxR family transcriptional regulator, quorum-sensing system regulator SdiA
MWHYDESQFKTTSADGGGSNDGMTKSRELNVLFEELGAMSPKGFSAGLHIRFAAPLVFVQTYCSDWVKLYTENAYALRDPLVFWGLGVKGATRWSAIKLPDPFNIIGQARKHGLEYGAVFSFGPITSRTIVGIARDDREFSDEEIAKAADLVTRLHVAAEPPSELTGAQVEALRLLAEGDRHTAAAAKLGISESALKARLSSARTRLGARTTAEALRKAREFRLL